MYESVKSLCSEVKPVTFLLDDISFSFASRINLRHQSESLSSDFSNSSRFLKHDLLYSMS